MITTSRLILRPWTLKDIPVLTEMVKEKEIYSFTRVPKMYTQKLARQFILKVIRAKNEKTFAVVLKKTNTVIGSCSLMNIDNHIRKAEIGYLIHKDYRKNGFCYEAASALLKLGFDKLKLNKLSINCAVKNIPSKIIIEKLGCTYEGLLRADIKSGDGKIHDKLQYSILKSEYLAQKKKK